MKSKTELICENMQLLKTLGELVAACSNPIIPGETVHAGVRMPDKATLERARAIYCRINRTTP